MRSAASQSYDGVIYINEGDTQGAEWQGSLTVYGCHASSTPLNMCITNNEGTVTISQSGCENQVETTCTTPTGCY